MNPMKYLAIEGDLAHAIAMGRPAVALPTADAPAALAAAAEAVRGNGCIDAPVTVFEGLLRIGSLPRQEDPHFARPRVADCGNLPVFLAEGGSARTALSCAILAASMAGISLLATPLIGELPAGGLPARGLPADLRSLTRTPVAVVCAGIASPFEPAACLAGLRRRGVPLIGFGGFLEGFALAADLVTEDPQKVARTLHSKWSLGLPGGALILLGSAAEFDPQARFAACASVASAIAAAYAALG